MKVLSLTQPWATLVAIGAKHFETRSWGNHHYRGPLAIHASKAFPRECRELCQRAPFASVLHSAGYGYGTGKLFTECGHIIAVVDLVNCFGATWLTDGAHPACERERKFMAEHEIEFGDYSEGRWAWRLDNVRRLAPPIPARGSLGLWTFPDAEILAGLEAA